MTLDLPRTAARLNRLLMRYYGASGFPHIAISTDRLTLVSNPGMAQPLKTANEVAIFIFGQLTQHGLSPWIRGYNDGSKNSYQVRFHINEYECFSEGDSVVEAIVDTLKYFSEEYENDYTREAG